ncbi:MAG: hypothetical protein NWQ38_00725 [Cellulophaga sp.]|nr:hypothetical protein [Cellulophaga sp.]
MEILQHILVYIILAIAVGYVVKKYFLPKRLFSSNSKKKSDGCGDCGC